MILEKLGNHNLPVSYIKYIVHRLTGMDFNAQLIDTLTMAFFLLSLIISVVLNIRDFRKKRTQKL